MTWEASPSGRRGRQQAYSDAAIQACLTHRVLFGLPPRQTTGFVASLLELVGLDWSVPDFSTLCRRRRTLSVAIPYKGSAGPLHLLIDSTRHKGGGRRRMERANTVDPNDGYGARYISGSTSKHWKYGQSRSQVVASGMRPFYQACSSNSATVKRYSFLQIRSPLQSRKPHILAL